MPSTAPKLAFETVRFNGEHETLREISEARELQLFVMPLITDESHCRIIVDQDSKAGVQGHTFTALPFIGFLRSASTSLRGANETVAETFFFATDDSPRGDTIRDIALISKDRLVVPMHFTMPTDTLDGQSGYFNRGFRREVIETRHVLPRLIEDEQKHRRIYVARRQMSAWALNMLKSQS